jgi:glyoxylase-like metal-dependent hydrolase (beta-lactamase superfamily II)
VSNIVANVKACGFSPERLFLIISTHAHVDHIGGNAYFQREYGCEICAHELDASRIESGQMIGSEFYGVDYKPCRVTRKMTGPEMSLHAGDVDLHALHIPGHTPGSIAVYTDIEGTRVLFGQDVHGPYIPQWGAWMEQVGPSLKKMKELNADILCEGHFGVFSPNGEVTRYIDQFLTRFG